MGWRPHRFGASQASEAKFPNATNRPPEALGANQEG
jgi:hypothetical protein